MAALNPIIHPLDTAAFDQINVAPKDLSEFLDHVISRPWTMDFVALKITTRGEKKVQVTRGTEVITQNGTENLQPSHAPLATEIANLFQGKLCF